MTRPWEDQDITKAIKSLDEAPLEGPRAERLWLRMETRLLDRQKPFWGFTAWRPWGHPVRWVAMAACLIVGFSGIYVHQNSVDQGEMASYLLSVSNPVESVGRDPGLVRVSALLTDSAASDGSAFLEDDQTSPFEVDDVYL